MIRVRRLGDIATHEQALFEAVRTWAELEAERNGGALPMPVTISTLVGDVLVKRIHPQAEEGDGGWEDVNERELLLRDVVATYRRCLAAEHNQLAEVTRLSDVMMACPAAGRRSASTEQADLDAFYAAQEAVEKAEEHLKRAVWCRRQASQAVFDAALATFPETE